MTTNQRTIVRCVASALAACAAVACTSAPANENEGVQTQPAVFHDRAEPGALKRPWTMRFREAGTLGANRVRIEGPSDLLQHVAIAQEPELFDYTTRTVPDGLLQTMRRRADASNARAIRAQLDEWQILSAFELEVLQRPGDGPVRVIADGEVIWLAEGKDPVSSAHFEVVGEHPLSE